MRAGLFLVCAGALLAAASPAHAGTVAGEAALTPADLAIRTMKPNPYVGQLMASAPRTLQSAATADTGFGVAWIADVPAGAGGAARSSRMDQLEQHFIPRILVVPAGQSVEFVNSDNVFHNIFSYSPPKKFDLGRYPKGHSRSVTFVKPGEVQVYCDIHSDMRADIIVVPNALWSLVGRSGRYRIDRVPAGAHTLKVWLPSTGERSYRIDVPAEGMVAAPPAP